MSTKESLVARHDLTAIIVALLAIVVFALVHRAMAAPPWAHLSRQGITVTYPASFVGDHQEGGDTLPSEITLSSIEDPSLGLEIKIEQQSPFDGPLDAALEFERAQSHGAMYQQLATRHKTIAGKDWIRTEFAYAYKTTPGDAPRVAWAVEYAAVNKDKLYIVTLHGDQGQLHQLDEELAAQLRLN